MTLTEPLPHPARYSEEVLPIMARFLVPGTRVLDPFSGTGERHEQIHGVEWVRVELEEGWADMVQGNALQLPFANNTFDAVATSCTYGNRMADHHDAKDNSKRITYRHKLGRPLRQQNSGQLQWGTKYREFHEAAWKEARRVLKPGGRLVLNVSDHIRGGGRQPVVAWHIEALRRLGFYMVTHQQVTTRRMGFGKNGQARVEQESVLLFTL